MPFIVTPPQVTADVEAYLTEWAKKTKMSISANVNVTFSH